MDIKMVPPGWEKITPLEDCPEITCELKRLSFAEQLDNQAALVEELEANKEIQFASDYGKGIFTKYSRKYEGLSINGVAIRKPTEILDGSVPGHPVIGKLFMAVMTAFINLNILKDEEIKNSDRSPVTNGVAAKAVS